MTGKTSNSLWYAIAALALIGAGALAYWQWNARGDAEQHAQAPPPADPAPVPAAQQAAPAPQPQAAPDQARAAQELAAREQAVRQQAAQEAETNAWATAQRTNTVDGYDFYLSLYPTGANAGAARRSRQRLYDDEADGEAWAAAQRAHTASAYDGYLRAFPNGRNAAAARRARTSVQGNPRVAQLMAGQPVQVVYPEWQEGLTDLRFTLTYRDGQLTISNLSFNFNRSAMASRCATAMPSASQFWARTLIRVHRGEQRTNLGSGAHWTFAINPSTWATERYTGRTQTINATLEQADIESGALFFWFFFAPEGVDSGCGGGRTLISALR